VGHVAIMWLGGGTQVITTGALVMELSAALMLGATVLVYDYHSSKDSSSYY
jgi:hypothetical protein